MAANIWSFILWCAKLNVHIPHHLYSDISEKNWSTWAKMVLKNPNNPPIFLRTEEPTGQATLYLKKAENQIFIKNTLRYQV
jgi:hypothetical protein